MIVPMIVSITMDVVVAVPMSVPTPIATPKGDVVGVAMALNLCTPVAAAMALHCWQHPSPCLWLCLRL